MSVPKSVSDAFKRFDADGSGAISRDELAAVLLELDDSWTEESIDQLLCEADTSMDGELQVEEFMRWVFAEDSAALGGSVKGAVSDVTLLVAGCSNWEKFDGEYVQVKGMVHGRRPVFYSAELGQYLYYHGKRGQWQIFHKISNLASCRLKTKRAAHVVGYGTKDVWEKWDPSTKSFIKEPDMGVCILPPPTPEELREAAPKLAYQANCPLEDGEPLGLWYKMEEEFNERPVYQKMKRQKDGSMWGLAARLFFSNGRWKMCGKGTSEDEKPYACSEETQSYSPVKATWNYKGKARQWTTPNEEDFRAVPPGWKDPDFSEMHMLGVWDKEIEYVRALELSYFKSPDGKAVLFGDIEPGDAIQGGVGDCWLMASISSLAEFPEFIQNNIFQTKEIPEDGKYELKLFDFRSSEWKTITIDDYLPCFAGSVKDAHFARSFYARLPQGKMWAALLEKGIAKLLGSYKALDGGIPPTAFTMLTGCQENIRHGAPHGAPVPEWKAISEIEVVDKPDGQVVGCLGMGTTFQEVERNGYHVKFTKIEGEGPAEGWLRYYVKGQRVATRTTKYPWSVKSLARDSGDRVEKSNDEVWEEILKLDVGNYPLYTCINEYRSNEESLRDGLVANHVYTVLHAKEACGRRMVCMRNPWGQFEWIGPWNDKGEEWKANPDVAKTLQVDLKADGAFWMDYEDFTWNMDGVMHTNIVMPTKRAGQDDLVDNAN